MTRAIYLAPTGSGVGLTSVGLGLFHALDRLGVRVGYCKPIGQPHENDNGPDRSIELIRSVSELSPPDPIDGDKARAMQSDGDFGLLLEKVVPLYAKASEGMDIVLVEGLVQTLADNNAGRLNAEVAKMLDAQVVLVGRPGELGDNPKQAIGKLQDRVEITADLYGGTKAANVLGCILNKLDAGGVSVDGVSQAALIKQHSTLFAKDSFKLLGCIPWQPLMLAARTNDVAEYLDCEVIHAGAMQERRVCRLHLAAESPRHAIDAFRAGTLIVSPADRDDIVLLSCMASRNGVPLAGLLLTGDCEPDAKILELGTQAQACGLPVLHSRKDSYTTLRAIEAMNPEVPTDDPQRLQSVMENIAGQLEAEWIVERMAADYEPRLSPPAFRYQLVQRANKANKRIVLPEGDEPRTVQAAIIAQQRGIADCILVAERSSVEAVAAAQGLTLPEDIKIIEPDSVREQYIEPMVELRKHKGLAADMAAAQLEDNVVLATMMLAQDEVDGLVSGAVNTTANTVRPAMQLIKTAANAKLVSSIFFMCLPEQVLVYGDCAINPDPNAEQLADIAINSAESAEAFGIPARVAMLSYSTGVSGSGSDVEKVREATEIARKLRPDLIIDGPLQYDAAAVESVARKKAPDSPVAGKATVFIFPDLNTGNTTYKAVQRSANVISVGPMLQGLKKPVNDLSRGALVDDIVFTIALTAIQAAQVEGS